MKIVWWITWWNVVCWMMIRMRMRMVIIAIVHRRDFIETRKFQISVLSNNLILAQENFLNGILLKVMYMIDFNVTLNI